jgi:ribosomal protein S18 acetylase RimI-like enzyme
MNIRPATRTDLPALLPLFEEARRTIAALGIDQWQNGYPNEAVLAEDIALSRSFCATAEAGAVRASLALLPDGEPTYDHILDGTWLTGDRTTGYLAIHRVAIAVACRGQGLAAMLLAFAADYARARGLTSLRIDTHQGNVVMRRMLEKNGFTHCGTILLKSGDPRVAYEKILP